MQGAVLVSQRLVLFEEEESSSCLPLRRAEWGFSLNLPTSQVVKRCWWKGSINARSKNSVYNKLITFSVEINIVQISGRDLIPACVHILCTYTWRYFVPHFMCSLLVRGNWNSREMVVQEQLSLRQQPSPSCQRNFLGTYCLFLDRIFYSQSHWIWSKVEKQFNTVVADWKNYVALMKTESV